MAIIVDLSETEVRGIIQIARERTGDLDPSGVQLVRHNSRSGILLEVWDTAVLGLLPSRIDIALAATRYVEPERVAPHEVGSLLLDIQRRLEALEL